MNERLRMAETIQREWRDGVCHYCGVTDAEIDGDRIAWLGRRRRVCNRPGCARQFWGDVDRALARQVQLRPRKKSPAEVHALIQEEKRRKRREYRLRRKGRAA